jgi:hypothetical protein
VADSDNWCDALYFPYGRRNWEGCTAVWSPSTMETIGASMRTKWTRTKWTRSPESTLIYP